MREKIIGVSAVVVVIVGVLSFALMRIALGDLSNKGDAQRAVTSAVAQLQVEGLRIERWLDHRARQEESRQPFEAGTPKARADKATQIAGHIEEAAKSETSFSSIAPSLVVVFDDKGVVVGRNGSGLMRGDKIGERHPEMMKTILSGATGSDAWVTEKERMLASYAPVRDAQGNVVGGITVGTPFNDERLQNTSDATSQRALLAASLQGDAMTLLAKSSQVSDAMAAGVGASRDALATNQVITLAGLPEDLDGAAKRLEGYGDGSRLVILAVTPARVVGSFTSLLWPLALAILIGMVLSVFGAYLLDAYISRPISDLEDGLLAVINGQTDIRFELEHKVLGGLVFRINSLLNQLLGVKEDDTDEEGRVSHVPSSSAFSAALNVDETMASLAIDDVADAVKLRDEAPEDYYKRIYDEYIAAKKALGDPVDHVKFAPFSQRIKASEQELAAKHGRAFRYKIEVKDREIVLLAVPLD